jgi:hypothetical protein
MNTNFKFLIASLVVVASLGNISAETTPSNNFPEFKFKGDFRVRLQHGTLEDNDDSRLRERIRLRLGGKAQLDKKTSIKFGLATGGVDSRSTNQTLQDSFQTPDLRLDYAFVKHQLTEQWTVLAGKMKNPLWRPSNLLWDGDINPDGAAATYSGTHAGLKWSVVGGYFVLDEISSSEDDPFLLAFQPKVEWMLNKSTKARAALGYFSTQHVEGLELDRSSQSNTNYEALEDEFSSIVLSGQLDFNNQFGLALIRPFGEIVINTNKSSSEKGGIIGVVLGDNKVNKKGNWQTKLNYRYLQADAWLDILPDADAYGGATNSEGVNLGLTYGVSNVTTFTLTYFSMDAINGDSNKNTIVQADLSYKF